MNSMLLKYAKYSLDTYFEIHGATFIFNPFTKCKLHTFNENGDMYIVFCGAFDISDLPNGMDIRKLSPSWLPDVEVHRGALEMYDSVREHIHAEIMTPRNIITIGHSMGGALATLAAMDLHNLGYNIISASFGSPRVGDKKFVEKFNNAINTNYRVVNFYDPIQYVPTTLRFCHVKGKILLDNKDPLYLPQKNHSIYTYVNLLERAQRV